MTQNAPGWEPPISEHEPNGATRDQHQAHRTCQPTMRTSAVEVAEVRIEGDADRPATSSWRCGFLLDGGGGLAAALATCSSSSSKEGGGSSPASTLAGGTPAAAHPSGSSLYTEDLKVITLATALENPAVGAFPALAAAKAGKLVTVPLAVAAFATTATGGHADHAKVWSPVPASAGVPAITKVPLSNRPATLQALGSVADVADAAKPALGPKQQAAETCLFATYNVTSPGGISIAPVEAVHAAILNFVLGHSSVPDDFLPTDRAASPALLTV